MTPEEMKTFVQKELNETLAPIKTQLGEFAKQAEGIAGLGEQLKTLTESVAALEINGSGKGKPAEKGKTDPAAATGAGLTTEQATELFQKMLKEDREAQTATQQSAADQEAWIKKNAPKLAGSAAARRIFAGTKTDEDRATALKEYRESIEAQGLKLPDQGSDPEKEGGKTVEGDDAKQRKIAAIRSDKGGDI